MLLCTPGLQFSTWPISRRQRSATTPVSTLAGSWQHIQPCSPPHANRVPRRTRPAPVQGAHPAGTLTTLRPMTFSIAARSSDASQFGVAVASKFLAVGAAVPAAEAGVGAIATQVAWPTSPTGRTGLRLAALRRARPEQVLADPDRRSRRAARPSSGRRRRGNAAAGRAFTGTARASPGPAGSPARDRPVTGTPSRATSSPVLQVVADDGRRPSSAERSARARPGRPGC